MTQKKKLTLVKKIVPILYDIALAGICFYIGCRVRAFFNLFIPFETGYFVGGILLLYYLLNLMLAKRFLVAKTKALTYITSIATFVVMYLSMSMVLVDSLQLILSIFIADREIRNLIFFSAGCICFLFTVISMIIGVCKTRKIKELTYTVPCATCKKDMKLVLLTDLHIGYFVGVKHMQKMVEQVNAMDADAVLLSGDIINAGNTRECKEIDEVAKILSTMHSKKGTFAVMGNHDPEKDDPDFLEFLERAHIRMLIDEIYTDDDVQFIGRMTKTKPRQKLSELMAGIDRTKPTVVLDHDPVGIKAATENHADIILCGHTHKGQVFPLNLFVRLVYSKAQLWGVAKREDTTSVVSAGVGYFSMPMRIGTDCEIVTVQLTEKK